jgi:hyperpolarization activated cyclic nucleotide-gated potassium channel 2
MFSLINCFVLPIDIAFQPTNLEGLFMNIVNGMIDVCFIVDILFNFRTTMWNPLTGEEIFDTREIAMSYLKNRFIVDLISSIPLDRIVDLTTDMHHIAGNLALLSMLKIVRILRFTKIISYLNATEDVKLSLKLFKMIFYLIIYIHW